MQDLTDEFCYKTDEIGENSGTAAAVPAVPGASSLQNRDARLNYH